MHDDVDISLLTVATNSKYDRTEIKILLSWYRSVLSPKSALADKLSREVVEWLDAPRDSATQDIAPPTPHFEKGWVLQGSQLAHDPHMLVPSNK